MKKELACTLIGAFCLAVVVRIAGAQDYIPVDPTLLKTGVTTAVQIGDGYGTLDQPFDVKITVLEIQRGEKAWATLKSTSPSNTPPNPGFEYLIARIRFEMLSKTGNYTVSPDYFTASNSDGKEYETFPTQHPKPALNGRLWGEDSMEGWIAFQVAQQDAKPLMSFGQGGIHGHGRVWFRLY
jgi:hypothetical protein